MSDAFAPRSVCGAVGSLSGPCLAESVSANDQEWKLAIRAQAENLFPRKTAATANGTGNQPCRAPFKGRKLHSASKAPHQRFARRPGKDSNLQKKYGQ
jgi:hypothetical protein